VAWSGQGWPPAYGLFSDPVAWSVDAGWEELGLGLAPLWARMGGDELEFGLWPCWDDGGSGDELRARGLVAVPR
jgi:hypothetical protein